MHDAFIKTIINYESLATAPRRKSFVHLPALAAMMLSIQPRNALQNTSNLLFQVTFALLSLESKERRVQQQVASGAHLTRVYTLGASP